MSTVIRINPSCTHMRTRLTHRNPTEADLKIAKRGMIPSALAMAPAILAGDAFAIDLEFDRDVDVLTAWIAVDAQGEHMIGPMSSVFAGTNEFASASTTILRPTPHPAKST